MSGPGPMDGPGKAHPGDGGAPGNPGFSGRIEAAARHRAPAPRGKGVVMILIGVAVLVALIWDFSGRGAASRRTREEVERSRLREPVVAPKDPKGTSAARPGDGPEAPEGEPAPDPDRAGMIKVRMGQAQVSMRPDAAIAWWLKSPEEERPTLRLEILAALVEPASGKGPVASEAFEAAAWLLEDAAGEAQESILHLTNATTAALQDDEAADGALLFLSRLPGGVDMRSAVSLDALIVDPARPLRLRIAAARIRPQADRTAKILKLADDDHVHPALRDALK